MLVCGLICKKLRRGFSKGWEEVQEELRRGWGKFKKPWKCSEKCVKPAEIYFLTQRTPSAAQRVTECNLFETKSLCVSVKELRALCVIIALNGLTQFFEQSHHKSLLLLTWTDLFHTTTRRHYDFIFLIINSLCRCVVVWNAWIILSQYLDVSLRSTWQFVSLENYVKP